MVMLTGEEGREKLLRRLAAFRSSVLTHEILSQVFREAWFAMVEDAIRQLRLLRNLESEAPQTLPFVEYGNDPRFLEKLGIRLLRLSRVPGFSPRRYRERLLSSGAEVIGTLFEINVLSRWHEYIIGLEPPLPAGGGGGEAHPEAILRCRHFDLFVECMVLFAPEEVVELPRASEEAEFFHRRAKRITDKILQKASQLKTSTLPSLLVVGLGPHQLVWINAPTSPAVDGANQALQYPLSAPVSSLMIALDFRADQIAGPFANVHGRHIPDDVRDELRRPWVPKPTEYPLNQWSPVEAIPD